MTDHCHPAASAARSLFACGLAAFLAGALSLTLAAGAHAAPTWLGPTDLAVASQQPSSLRVALDADGDAVAVWRDCASSICTVRAATRPAGGSSSNWSPPQNLSDPETIGDVQLELDKDGGAVAVWEVGSRDPDGNMSWTVRAANRPAGGTWEPAANVSPPHAGPGGFDVALSANGDTLAMWAAYAEGPCDPLEQTVIEQLPEAPLVPEPCENGKTTVNARQAATRAAGESSWGEPKTVARAGQYTSLRGVDVGLDANGNGVAVWNRYNGTSSVVQAADYDAATDSWSSPQDISPSPELQYAEGQDLAVDARGNAVVAWYTEYYYDRNSTVLGVTRDAGESWGDTVPEPIPLPYQHARNPKVAFDGQGNAVAAWHGGASNSSSSMIQAAIRPPGGPWGNRRDLSSPSRSSDVSLAVDPAGNGVAAAWTRNIDGDDTVEVVTRPAGAAAGLWSEVKRVSTDVSRAGQDAAGAQIALDPEGNGVAAWSQHNGTQHLLRAAGYDVEGPRLRSMAVPAAVAAGSPLAFSVSPLDVWSDVASTTWSFGDGSSAARNGGQHIFSTPGNYKVKLTSTDSRGNSTTAEKTVAVSPAGSGEGGSGSGGTSGGAGTQPAGGVVEPTSNGGNGSTGPLPASEARRTSGLRRCLSRARRSRRRHASRNRRRCLARYGRIPGRVTGLRARSLSRTQVALSFRAPGTDRQRGPAANTYLVKQSTRPIRGRRGFRRARSLCRGSCRLAVGRVGAKVTLEITDLRPNTTYYYAVAARDNVSKRLGPRSASVRVRTR